MIPLSIDLRNQIALMAGIDPLTLSPLGGGREDLDGVTYAYPSAQGTRVLKIIAVPASDPFALERIHERLRFVHFLGERGVAIVYPLPGPNRKLLSTLVDGDKLYIAYVMDKVAGVHPKPPTWTPAFYSQWGRLVGKLHRVTQQYPDWRCSSRLDAAGSPILGWEGEWQGFYEQCADSDIRVQWQSVRARLEQLPLARDCFGFTHNDPHFQNILADGDRLTLLDFDVANYHWFASDIAIALQSVLFTKSGGMERPVSDPTEIETFLTAFSRGYAEENHLDLFWWDQVELFVSYRRILLFTAMQGWLNTEPEKRAAWKQMIVREPRLLPHPVSDCFVGMNKL